MVSKMLLQDVILMLYKLLAHLPLLTVLVPTVENIPREAEKAFVTGAVVVVDQVICQLHKQKVCVRNIKKVM